MGVLGIMQVSVIVLLSCSFFCIVYGNGDEVELVSWTQPPHLAPIYPPVGEPAPHHHKGGHHHHTKASPPPAKPPVKPPSHAPVKPPSHAPVKPPSHAPVKPPSHAPVKPPSHAPVKPPSHAPVKPPSHAPVKPPSHSPVKPPSHSPVKPPSHSPVKPPRHAPVKPPTHAPVKPPSHPPSYPVPTRKLVAVQGVVYCKFCKYIGVDNLLRATPLLGAVVKLQCNNTKHPLNLEAKTDKNGYFFLVAPKTITTYGVRSCKVSLLSSPNGACNKPTNLHYGLKGATLIPTKAPPAHHPLAFDVFNVGPFAFEPSIKTPCPH